ncbi:MAG: hypothetical protein O7C59_02340 [Rickettsia endosymbiont of Ixodes persulcatus]|nr:hypothetical protein [Rickettsia endosymbiont of Ixodes persulcatus]MCZ6913436.1 hypothetical protein [Rickettsia endosymbiont of Ixodes persulcatus]MCZ6924906.1 hypothetical protein [Rickettsia endosymbiont of Ixodes persulcatus]
MATKRPFIVSIIITLSRPITVVNLLLELMKEFVVLLVTTFSSQ